MHRYIGIDAHTESCTVAVMGPSGRRLKEVRLETNGQVLTDFVRSVAGHKHICLEEGTQAEWLYEMLEPLADEVVVQLPPRSDGVKNDSVDAWRRADELRRGDIKRMVYKAPGKFTALRAAARAYEVGQRDMVRAKTRLNALYRSRGVQGGRHHTLLLRLDERPPRPVGPSGDSADPWAQPSSSRQQHRQLGCQRGAQHGKAACRRLDQGFRE